MSEVIVPNLILPVLMIVIGYFLYSDPPKKRNFALGIRTYMSMKSEATWDYAQVFTGKLFFYIGILEILAVCVIHLILGYHDLTQMISILEIIVLGFIILADEISLYLHFDHKGNKKSY